MDFSQINYWALLVATVASFGLGALWYSVLFGKAWQEGVGMTKEDMEGANMGKIFGICLVLTGIMAFGMAMLIQGHGAGAIDWMGGLKHGLFIGGCFVATSIGINYLYQRKSFKLWLIDAGYQVLFIALQGAIFGAWH